MSVLKTSIDPIISSVFANHLKLFLPFTRHPITEIFKATNFRKLNHKIRIKFEHSLFWKFSHLLQARRPISVCFLIVRNLRESVSPPHFESEKTGLPKEIKVFNTFHLEKCNNLFIFFLKSNTFYCDDTSWQEVCYL